MLTSMGEWTNTGAAERRQLAIELAAALGPEWRPVPRLRGAHQLAAVLHVPSNIEFVAIPGGTFSAGVQPEDADLMREVEWNEESSAEWLEDLIARQGGHATVAPFLIARAPVLAGAAQNIAGEDAGWVTGDEGSPAAPIRFTKEQCTPILAAFPWRLPTGHEWEWVARTGATTAFLNGATAAETEAACKALYASAYEHEVTGPGQNGFGVWGLPWGDWVATAAAPRLPHAGRGGAAMLYPWQSDEIIMQLAGLGDDGCANDEQNLRFALDLPASLAARSSR